MLKMQEIMGHFREAIDEVGSLKVEKTLDYKEGLDGLPKSDVIKFILEGGSSVVVRPSGTEPKLKTYISVIANDASDAIKEEVAIKGDLEKKM